jgi:type II secretory pathway component PulJ
LNNKGVTLIELLIYIALFAIVTMIMGRQFKVMMSNYTSGKQMTRQQVDSRDMMGLMMREIRCTGLKVYLDSLKVDSLDRIVIPGVIAGGTPADSSSFKFTNQASGSAFDQLQIWKANLESNGQYDGKVDRIKFYVEDNILKRELSVNGAAATISTVAPNVYALQFEFGILAATNSTALVDQFTSFTGSSWSGTGWTGTGATKTITTSSGNSTGYLKYGTALSSAVAKNRKYLVTLKITPSNGFPANLNWMQVSFRDNNYSNPPYGYEKFKPFGGTMQLILKDSTSATTAYAYLEYSSKGVGTLDVTGFKVQCLEDSAYTWVSSFTTADSLTQKRNVRAIRMNLLTRSKGNAIGKSTSTMDVGGGITVNTPGDYAWRLYKTVIQVPNNGTF